MSEGDYYVGPERRESPPPTVEEVAHLRQRRILAAVLLALVGLLAVLSIVNTIRAENRADSQAFALRESQFRSCIVGGNALRGDVRAEFRDLKSPLIRFFAQIGSQVGPLERVVDQLHDELALRRATINQRIPNVDCLRIYPPLEDQVYPKITPPDPR